MIRTVSIFFIIFISSSLFSIDNTVSNSSIYNRGLGGPHSGMARGFHTFFNNPALLAEYDPELLFFQLNANLKGDALKIANLYLGGSLSLDDPAGVLSTLQDQGLTRLLIGVEAGGPVAVGHIGNNWGWCVKNSSNVYVDLPYLLGTSKMLIREDLTFALGLSYPLVFPVSDNFIVEFIPGVMSRTTIRGEVEIEKDLLGLVGVVSDTESIITDNPINISPMFAVDIGFLVKLNDIVKLSGVVKDIYTPILKYPVTDVGEILDVFTTTADTTGNIVYREINFGLGVDIPLGPLEVVVSDFDIYLDYYDLLRFEKNPLLHLGIGTDITLLDKLHLLAGFNEGLLSLGLNVDVKGFDVGFAMYGTEEGSQPGMRSVMNFLISIGVSL